MMENSITVSQLNTYIKDQFAQDLLLGNICLRGEISNFKAHSSGHLYMTIKDSESSIRAVMFRSDAARLRFAPGEGDSVLAFGHVSVFIRDGQYQLYISSMLADGQGDLYRAFEKLKAKLEKQGMFEPEHKKAIPRFASKIALVTSSTGAVVHDMIRILRGRGFAGDIIVCPVAVQGPQAPDEIAAAIELINQKQLADLIITGRGGGSFEDLAAFNTQRVALAIFGSQIPVISAVGHEPDVTIADYVADVRAATPSNGAEIATQYIYTAGRYLKEAGLRIQGSMLGRIEHMRQLLGAVKDKPVFKNPTDIIAQKRLTLDFLQNKMVLAAVKTGQERRGRFVALAAKLDALSPVRVLARGYAAVTKQEKAVDRASGLAVGDKINLTFADGSVDCRVEET